MAFGIAKIARLDRRAKLVQAAPKGLRIAHDLRRVLAPKLLHLAGGYHQRGQGEQVMIAGCAGEDAAIGRWPVFLFTFRVQVAQNHTTLRAGKGFVRAGRHPGRALVQWLLELAARDQPEYMSAIIEQWNILRFTECRHLFNRFGEEKQAFTHYYQLW